MRLFAGTFFSLADNKQANMNLAIYSKCFSPQPHAKAFNRATQTSTIMR